MLSGMVLDDDESEDVLPLEPSEAEVRLTLQLGQVGLRVIDANIVRHAKEHPLKVKRVVLDAAKAGGFSLNDEGVYDLHVRRLIGLVERGVLVGLGEPSQAGVQRGLSPWVSACRARTKGLLGRMP